MKRVETVSILAGVYRGAAERRGCLTHSIIVESDDLWAPKTLCGSIPNDHLADTNAPTDDPLGVDGKPTCARCLKKDPRFK